jgi:hypothetical protein
MRRTRAGRIFAAKRGEAMTGMIRRVCVILRGGALLALAFAFLSPRAGTAMEGKALEPEQIRMVQRALNDHGMNVAVTGSWDQRTRAAIGTFQSENGLPSTGTLDPATSRALGVDPYEVVPVGGRLPEAAARSTADDPAVNCAINTTVDCRPGP